MSLPPDSLDPIPDDTARIAHASFPKGTLALVVREVLGTIYHDGMFADLFPSVGQPALAPWRLALVTILQYAEHLTDRQAAHAVRARIDWKYALALPLEHAGFEFTALATFRERLVAGGAEERLLWALLEQCQEQGLLRKRGRIRTDSTHVLAAVRSLNRVELVGETLRAALEAVAVAAPDWLRGQVTAEWAERYGRRVEEYRLPEGEEQRQALAEEIGRDGAHLLRATRGEGAPSWLSELPAIGCLRQVWTQQYDQPETSPRFRPTDALPPAHDLIASPYDTEARWGKKRQVRSVGYKAHVTESCEPDLPALITGVETTPAPVPDQAMVEPIWEDLAARDLLPGKHTVDAGRGPAAGDHADRAAVTRLELASPSPGGVRAGGLPARLGGPAGELSGRQTEHELAADHQQSEAGGDPSPLPNHGLSGVSGPSEVHHGQPAESDAVAPRGA